jgi:large repetitive protein
MYVGPRVSSSSSFVVSLLNCVSYLAALAALLTGGASQAQLTASFAPAWTQQSPAASPSAREYANAVYDAATGQVVLFGGASGSAYLNDTWTWNGTTWTQENPATSPSARSGASMAYDETAGTVVLFGGNNSNGVYLNDTWTWNGTTWTQQSPTNSPTARSVASMAYDVVTKQIVLFGGNNNTSTLGDTWIWSGTAWTQESPANSPTARSQAGMAYHTPTGQVVLFGGVNGTGTNLNDTWTWNGTTWTQQSPATSPPARTYPSMAYDPATGQAVLFGGVSGSSGNGTDLNDTWVWNGTTWTLQNTSVSPTARYAFGMDYDAATGQIVLFGGNASSGIAGDTWTLQLGAVNLGAANVCSSGEPTPCSQSATLTYTFSGTSGTIEAPVVLTQGTPNLDFTDAGTGTCTNGTSYSSGDTCTVVVTFTPKAPGTRMGAVELLNSSGTPIATTLVSGTGDGPEVTVTPGTISTVAGDGVNPNVADNCAGSTDSQGDGCVATSAELNTPWGVAVDSAGNLYIADGMIATGGPATRFIRKVTAATGIISTIASGLVNPYAVAVDGAGNVYIADSGSSYVYEVTPASTTPFILAGNGTAAFQSTPDNGTTAATSAGLFNPKGIAVDSAGNVYIADTTNNRVRKVTAATGFISTVAGDGGEIYVSDGVVATSTPVAPQGIAVDGAGNLYIADTINQRIRKVTAATGLISTVAGTGTSGYVASQDTGTTAATSAEISLPEAVAVDSAGNLYFMDSNNNRVRKVAAATGFISTVAGNGTSGNIGNGGPATSAEFGFGFGTAVDGAGNLYLTDYLNHLVRQVTATAATVNFATTNVGSASSDSPWTVTVSNIGTGVLTFPAPSTGGNPSITAPPPFTIGNASTCPQLTVGSGAGSLLSGASCTDLISFTPQALITYNGSLVTTDDTLNIAGSTQTVALSGEGESDSFTVTGVSPSFGPSTGGTTVTITGSQLTAVTMVSFGGVPAKSFTTGTATQMTAVAPAGTVGAVVDITVGTTTTVSSTSAADQFTYLGPSMVTGIAASSGYQGNSVTITGTNFIGVSAVSFGSVAATSYTVNSPTSITAMVPAGTSGSVVDVTVTNIVGKSVTSAADQFTYIAPTFTVTVTSDRVSGTASNCTNQAIAGATPDANCALRDAFAAINAVGYLGSSGQPTIGFATALNGSSIALSGSPISPTANFNLAGPGPAATITIQAASGYTNLFLSTTTASLQSKISGLTISGFKNTASTTGGAIFAGSSTGNYTYTSDTFTGNSNAASGGLGGALYLLGMNTLTGTTFAGNSAALDGGAIYASTGSSLTLTGTTFASNSATQDGGAIYANTESILTINTSTFGAVGATSPTNTAGISGGAIYATDVTTNITGSTFNYNTATSSGGAIFVTSGSLTVSSPVGSVTSFTGNQVTTQAVVSGGGGAIYLMAGNTTTLSNINFIGNSVSGATDANGGAIMLFSPNAKPTATISSSLFSGNQATGGAIAAGGAIYQTAPAAQQSGVLTLTNDTFTANMAAGTSSSSGGALYLSTNATNTVDNDTDTLYNDTITANTATGAGTNTGGGIYESGTLASFYPFLYNTIVANDTVSGGTTNTYPDTNAVNANSSCPTTYCNSASLSTSSTTTPILLSPLGSYGGQLQTMLPLPGSPALGAGIDSSTYVPDTEGDDARGYARTQFVNLTAPSVDAGAVESNYTLAFIQQPTTTVVGAMITPAPTVQLEESGHTGTAAASFAGGTLTLTAAVGTPSTTSFPTTQSGLETLNVSLSTEDTNNSLIAEVPGAVTMATEFSSGFNVIFPLPVVTGISPATGPATGGTTVTITGTNFGNPAAVMFGANQATITGGTNTILIATAPPGTIGSVVNVTVTTNASGTSATSPADLFSYTQALAQAIMFPQPPTPVVNGSAPITLSATGGASGNPVTFTVVSGPGAVSGINGTTLSFTGAGSVIVEADQAGNGTYLAAPPVQQTIVVNAAATSYVAPPTAVDTISAAQAVTVTFTQDAVLGSIQVLTQGAVGLDFNAAGGPPSSNRCTVGATYIAGQACVVEVRFRPKAPGARLGAVVLYDNSVTPMLLATSYIGGTGVSGQGLFTTGVSANVAANLGTARGVSVDAAGNIYVSEQSNGNVDKFAVGTGMETVLTSAGDSPSGTAVDGAGNVYFGSSDDNVIYELAGGAGNPVAIASGWSPDNVLLADGAGNLYSPDQNTGAIYEIAPGTRVVTTILPSGQIGRVVGMAIDANGNLYAADFNNNEMFSIAQGSSTATLLFSGNGLTMPHGVAIDAAGNLYVTNYSGDGNVQRYAAGTYAHTELPTGSAYYGIAIDGSGNLLTLDASDITRYTRTSTPTMTFGNTAAGTTTADQVTGFENDGNAVLTVASVETTAGFSLNTTDTTCEAGALAVAGTCNVAASFSPSTMAATANGDINITDNTLNVVGTLQQVPLTVTTGTAVTPVVTASSATISYGTASAMLSATVTYSGSIAPTGAVTFQVDSGATVAAVCSGATSPETCTATYPTSTLTATAHTITATVAADVNYNTASGTATLTVTPIAPMIVFSVANQTYGAAPFTVSATSNSTGAFTYTLVSGNATVTSAGVVTLTGSGPVMVLATEAAAGNYTLSTAQTTFMVSQAGTTTMLTANSAAIHPNQTVTLTAQVTSNTSGTPTGSVAFYVNGTILMTVPTTAGVAQLTTLLPPGETAAITAVYSGDANFTTSTGTTSVVVGSLDFTFTNTGASAYTAAPGAVASYSFALAPLYGSYAGPVSFTVTGLPAGAVASFTPSSVAADGGAVPVTMTVQTASAMAHNDNYGNSPLGRGVVLALLLLPFGMKRKLREKLRGRMLLLVLLLAGTTAAMTGCGSNSGFILQSPGTYTLTVTATSGTLQHSQIVTLIVQ